MTMQSFFASFTVSALSWNPANAFSLAFCSSSCPMLAQTSVLRTSEPFTASLGSSVSTMDDLPWARAHSMTFPSG